MVLLFRGIGNCRDYNEQKLQDLQDKILKSWKTEKFILSIFNKNKGGA